MFLDGKLTDYEDPGSYYATTELNGAQITLDLREFGERFMFYYRRYEPQYVATFRKLYAGGNFLDIGSNIGLYVVSMAAAVRQAGGRIYSVEPIPSNLARQQANVELNGCAELLDYAPVVLGAQEGTIRMSGDFGAASVNGVVADGGTREFPMTTLDRLAAERRWTNIGALKIDVEGYEPAVLRGGVEVLRRERPVILAEFNRERMAMNGFAMAESWQLLRELGYRGFALADGKLQELAEPASHENLFFLP
jgi:FkbM family methyltransferase